MSSGKFQIIENLWETQSSFKIFKKTSRKFLNSLLKVFKNLKKTPGRLKLLKEDFTTQRVANKYIL